jgi:hypothetical protein
MIFIGLFKTFKGMPRSDFEIGRRFQRYVLYERFDKMNSGVLEALLDVSVPFCRFTGQVILIKKTEIPEIFAALS